VTSFSIEGIEEGRWWGGCVAATLAAHDQLTTFDDSRLNGGFCQELPFKAATPASQLRAPI
jgi:hypothetical protein